MAKTAKLHGQCMANAWPMHGQCINCMANAKLHGQNCKTEPTRTLTVQGIFFSVVGS